MVTDIINKESGNPRNTQTLFNIFFCIPRNYSIKRAHHTNRYVHQMINDNPCNYLKYSKASM